MYRYYALYFDGKNAYQTNYTGDLQSVKLQISIDVRSNKWHWCHLFDYLGKLIFSSSNIPEIVKADIESKEEKVKTTKDETYLL